MLGSLGDLEMRQNPWRSSASAAEEGVNWHSLWMFLKPSAAAEQLRGIVAPSHGPMLDAPPQFICHVWHAMGVCFQTLFSINNSMAKYYLF